MGSHDPIAARSAWLYRLFTVGSARVSLTGETLNVEELLVGAPAKIPVGAVDSITVCPSWSWHRMTIRVAVVADSSPAGGVAWALQDIEAKARGGRRTVLDWDATAKVEMPSQRVAGGDRLGWSSAPSTVRRAAKTTT